MHKPLTPPLVVKAPAITQQLFASGLQTGYNKNPAGDSSGLGVEATESVINFNASEDLGGDYKVTAIMGFEGIARATTNGGGGDTILKIVI
jgi:hypothetical protein